MKKPLLLACVLALALAVTGCALIEKDAAVDMATPVVSIGDIVYTKVTVLNLAENYFSNYGSYYGATDSSMFIDTAVAELEQKALERYMVGKLGFNELTEDELARVEERITSAKQEELTMVKTYYFSGSTLEGTALDEAAAAKLVELGYTDEVYTQGARMAVELEKLRDSVVNTVTVSQEEARANFDSTVASAKESYAANLSAFGTSFNAGTQTYYTPAGYRNVKSLLVKFTDDDTAALSAIKTEISQKDALINSLQTSLTQYETAGDKTQEQQTAMDSLKTDLETAQNEKNDLTTKLSAATDTAYANIAATVATLRQRLVAGETFDALMTELGKDTAVVNTTTGYAICEGFTGKDAAMVEAAMALKAPGDVTQDDIKAANGYQILQYTSDMTEGEVAFESVKDLDAITKLGEKQNAAYAAQIEAWGKEHPVKVDTRSLKK